MARFITAHTKEERVKTAKGKRWKYQLVKIGENWQMNHCTCKRNYPNDLEHGGSHLDPEYQTKVQVVNQECSHLTGLPELKAFRLRTSKQGRRVEVSAKCPAWRDWHLESWEICYLSFSELHGVWFAFWWILFNVATCQARVRDDHQLATWFTHSLCHKSKPQIGLVLPKNGSS